MSKMNWGRVLLGGVFFALVYNIIMACAWYLFLKGEWLSAFAALGPSFDRTPDILGSTHYRLHYLLLTLCAGIAASWLYAAIRPRYGAGGATAGIAGLAIWFIGIFVPTLAWAGLLRLPGGLLAGDLVIQLIACVLATIAAAWPYQEP